MSKASTNRVGALLTRAREEGVIPWKYIVQEGRATEAVSSWADPAAFARSVQAAYWKDKWAAQPTRVIVVSEKGTVRGTLAPVLEDFEVEFLAVGGYASATRVRELAATQAVPNAKPLLLLYLGDHDPSGRGMSDQDLPQRLIRYATDNPADVELKEMLRTSNTLVGALSDVYGLEVRRIALTVEDTEDLGDDLGFPAADKDQDTRFEWFVETFGAWCWELDALNPNVLRERVRGAIEAELDHDAWQRYVAAEAAERESITKTLAAWKSISGLAQE